MGWTGIETSRSFLEVIQLDFNSFIDIKEVKTPKQNWDYDSIEESTIFAIYKDDNKANKAMVILCKRIDREVLYKDMSECMGPYSKDKCPKEILDQLSPIEELVYAGYSKEWRERQ